MKHDDNTFEGRVFDQYDKPPKKAYDLEYSTQTRREFEYLKENGIEPVFIKMSVYGIRTYKYKKTPALFKLLEAYYTMVANEKEYAKLNKDIKTNDEAKSDPQLMDALIEHGAPIKRVQIYA